MYLLLKRGGSMEGVLPEVKRDADFGVVPVRVIRSSRGQLSAFLNLLQKSPEQREASNSSLNASGCSGV